MPLTQVDLRQLTWRKARRSMNNGNCVEIAPADGRIMVRDSMQKCGPVLESPAAVWRTFIAEAKRDSIG